MERERERKRERERSGVCRSREAYLIYK